MRYGLLIPHFGGHADRDRLVEGARRAEELGFDSLWVRDHLVFHPHGLEGEDRTFVEPLTTLAYLAGVTERITLGTATIIPYRHPINMAASVAALVWLGRRRLELGIGSGNFQHEFDVIGMGQVDRPALMREQVEIARRLWAGESVEHHSDNYSFSDVDLMPLPTDGVRLWWGGATPASARLAVDFCEGWLPGRITFPTFERRVGQIRQRSEEQGKPMIQVGAIPIMSIAPTREEAMASMNMPALLKNANSQNFWVKPASGSFTEPEDLAGSLIAGITDDIIEGLERYAHLGADIVILDFRLRFSDWLEQIESMAADVLPRVRAPNVPAVAVAAT